MAEKKMSKKVIPQIAVSSASSSSSAVACLPSASASGSGVSAEILAQLGDTATVIKKAARECPVDSVTVFNDRAEVVREIVFTVDAGGLYDIVLDGITSLSEAKSVRVDALASDEKKKKKSKKPKSARGDKSTEGEKKTDATTPTPSDCDDDDGGAADDDKANNAGAATTGCTILEVSSELVSSEEHASPEIEALVKDQRVIEKEIAKLTRDRDLVQKQKKYLEKYATSLIGSAEQPQPFFAAKKAKNDDDDDSNARGATRPVLDIGVIGQFLDTFGTRMSEMEEKYVSFEEALELAQVRLDAVHKKLLDLRTLSGALGDNRSRRVTVGVYCNAPGRVALRCSYMVTEAHWRSAYDCRVLSESQQIQLIYFGDIFNGSNEHWESAKISLSTAEPTVGGEPPPLKTCIVEFGTPLNIQRNYAAKSRKFVQGANNFYGAEFVQQQQQQQSYAPQIQTQTYLNSNVLSPASNMMAPASSSSSTVITNDFAENNDLDVGVATAAVNDAPTSATFVIAGRKTIASDNKNHKVTISVQTLPTVFTHTGVVSCGKVFLRGTCVNKSDGALLGGEMAVFIDGSFVCNVTLKSVLPGAEFNVFLGVDTNVTMKVMPEKAKGRDVGIFSKQRVDEKRRVIKLKNHRKDAVQLTLFDQLPLSKDSSIKVKLIEPSPEDVAKKNSNVIINDFNNVRWAIPLESGADAEVVFHFEVSYPNDKEICYC